MRYLIIADIHGNLSAFQSVLHDAEDRGGFQQLWCLGDVVGYGPEPNECLDLLLSYDHICVAGNHDWAAVNRIEIADFNYDAAAANRWTSQQLTDAGKSYLAAMSDIKTKDNFTLVHGSPRDPLWEYLLSPLVAQENMSSFSSTYCLVGHSHIPIVFEFLHEVVEEKVLLDDETIFLGSAKMIVNPGSVGQPRDGDPRASYMLYDADAFSLSLHRVTYDIEATQRLMKQEGLPTYLISRLTFGQ